MLLKTRFSRYFYINDKSKVEDDNTPDKIVDEVAPDAGIKEESSNIESKELKASESEEAETVYCRKMAGTIEFERNKKREIGSLL